MANRKGFTLLEVLVALAIGGLVVGSVFQVIAAYAGFVGMQRAREDIQQNVRAAFEMIGSELRVLGPGDGLVRADRDSITIRVARLWGVVCEVGVDRLAVAFPTFAGADLGVNLGLGVEILSETPDHGGRWAARVDGVGPPDESCDGGLLAVGAERRWLSLVGAPAASGEAPRRGDIVSLFETVTYRTGPSAGVSGRWIQRRIGDGPGASNQPFAGPVSDREGGLSFEYFSRESAGRLPTPISDPSVRSEVERVQVIIETVGRSGSVNGSTLRADTIAIPLRNRVSARRMLDEAR